MSTEIEQDEENNGRDSFEEEHLQEYLNRVAEALEISNPTYCIKFGTKKGDNFGSIVHRVFVEGKKNGAKVKISTIVKTPPKDETARVALQISHIFPREHYFYLEIVPIFKEFLNAKNKRLENIGECYFSSMTDHKEMICLEDLNAKGFVMRDHQKPMDFAHTSLAFRALGRLHALSFALRDQKPQIFKSKITTLKEVAFGTEFNKLPSTITRYETVGKLTKMALIEESPKYLERFSRYFEHTFLHTERSCDGSIAEPYAVLGHGDFWTNNMLFKYNGEDCTEPQDIYILDFQFARYASPAVDISFTLFCICNLELRQKYFDKLIGIYYKSLADYLLELGSDPEELFPFDALLDQLAKFSIYSAGVGVLAIPDFTSRGDDVPKIGADDETTAELEERFQRDSLFRNTLRDFYKDLIDRDYI